MSVLVCFHAHPDDECIATGGVMAKAASEGHRVVLVVATRGEHGEVPDGFLDDGEQLSERRVKETYASADVLGVERVEFLGYVDSGMVGTPENDAAESFWRADIEEAAGRLAAILEKEGADVLTIYDHIGVYGHPDHIQVYRVGKRAAELAGIDRLYQATMNRDHIIRGMREQREAMSEAWDDGDVPDFEADDTFGMPESAITARVDVGPWLDNKRRAMQAHASQITEQSFFLRMPPEAFQYAFGTEWFIREGHGPGITETDIV